MFPFLKGYLDSISFTYHIAGKMVQKYESISSKLLSNFWSAAMWVPDKGVKICHITMRSAFGK